LKGTEKPAGAAEQLELAQVCLLKRAYATAARFSRDAFAADPKLAADLPSEARYDAACAAALAGCGQGEDEAGLSEDERAGWRKQARAWLGAELAAWGRKADGANAAERLLARKTLAHWQADADLAGIREPGALGKLSAEERKEWLALWREVGSLLRRGG
jgi:hypothetical protein